MTLRAFYTVLLLMASNTFMTLAWYGHLRFKDAAFMKNAGMFKAILISWGIAFIEYCLMVPANRMGSNITGGPFNMWQLKLIQEVVSVSIFVVFTLVFFRHERLGWNHLIGFMLMLGAIYFFFKK